MALAVYRRRRDKGGMAEWGRRRGEKKRFFSRARRAHVSSHSPLVKASRLMTLLNYKRKTYCQQSRIRLYCMERIPFSLINYAAHCTAWLSYGKRLWPRQWAAGWESTGCVSCRRRGGGWAENPSRLTGVRISFEMPRIYENRSLSKEILHVVIHHLIMHLTIHKRRYVAHAFWKSAA